MNNLTSDKNNNKYIRVNNLDYSIKNILYDLEWITKTICFTKSVSDYIFYNNENTLTNGMSGIHSIPVEQSPSGTDSDIFEKCPFVAVETDQLQIVKTPPFLRYTETAKGRYRNMIHVLKELYINTMKLPDVEKVNRTIDIDFAMNRDSPSGRYSSTGCSENAVPETRETPGGESADGKLHMDTHLYLKHPDFILDHYIFHIYSYNHITDNYTNALTILKIFEYMCYKLLNYLDEVEFDASAIVDNQSQGGCV